MSSQVKYLNVDEINFSCIDNTPVMLYDFSNEDIKVEDLFDLKCNLLSKENAFSCFSHCETSQSLSNDADAEYGSKIKELSLYKNINKNCSLEYSLINNNENSSQNVDLIIESSSKLKLKHYLHDFFINQSMSKVDLLSLLNTLNDLYNDFLPLGLNLQINKAIKRKSKSDILISLLVETYMSLASDKLLIS